MGCPSEGRTAWSLAAFLFAALLSPSSALPAVTGPLAVGVNASGNCQFHGRSAALAFGDLEPTTGRDVSATASLVFKCTRGTVWSITDDGGLHDQSAGAFRMRHATLDAYLPYRLTYTNATGTSQGAQIDQTLSIDGLVRGAAYANVPAGSYADTVTITINQ